MSSATVDVLSEKAEPLIFGHPPGLFMLFFAEMWERFSYYGMRALLTFYMIKGFLAYSDNRAYAIYGAYTALVYATPFIGGMLADRLLGERKAVVMGGLLMAAGHLVMTVQDEGLFFGALALLIVGNGFFKPNISTVVGSLYPEGSTKRDSGFTLFYMGINLGAALAPLLCGYVGETFGWHYGFGLATIGMLIGLAVFAAPPLITRLMIMGGALLASVVMVLISIFDLPYGLDQWAQAAHNNMGLRDKLSAFFYGLAAPGHFFKEPLMFAVNAPIVVALLIAAGVAWVALTRSALPAHVGQPPSLERLDMPALTDFKQHLQPYYLAIIATAAILAYAVAPHSLLGFVITAVGLFAIALPWLTAQQAVYAGVVAAVPVVALLLRRDEIANTVLAVFGLAALGSIFREAMNSKKVERERLYVVLILMFFSMLFWAFFEQAGSSVNNFTDRNVDRVVMTQSISADQVGKTLEIKLTPEQLSRTLPGASEPLNLTQLDNLREEKRDTVQWQIRQQDVGMQVGGTVFPASMFQAANPIFILLFGLIFTALWSYLAKAKLEPSTPVKFALGLFQLGLGFGSFWIGAQLAGSNGMVSMGWLLLGYLLHTTGELCISPVGLSMVTKLSPLRIVSTVMGGWFLATAFSNALGGYIAMLTGAHGDGDTAKSIPLPAETLSLYSNVFGPIGITACVAAVIVLLLSPMLKRWMHEEPGQSLSGGHH